MVQKKSKFGINTGNTVKKPTWVFQKYEQNQFVYAECVECTVHRQADEVYEYDVSGIGAPMSLNKNNAWQDPCALFNVDMYMIVDFFDDHDCAQAMKNVQHFCENMVQLPKPSKTGESLSAFVLMIRRSGKDTSKFEIGYDKENVLYKPVQRQASPYQHDYACNCHMCSFAQGGKSMKKAKSVKNKQVAREMNQDTFNLQ